VVVSSQEWSIGCQELVQGVLRPRLGFEMWASVHGESASVFPSFIKFSAFSFFLWSRDPERLNPDFVINTSVLCILTIFPYYIEVALHKGHRQSFAFESSYVLSYQMHHRIFPVYALLNLAHVSLASRLPSVPL
jgi:hypothetical protein